MYKRLKNKRDINKIHYLTAANKFSPRTVNSQFFSAWLDATNTGGLLGSSLLSKKKDNYFTISPQETKNTRD